MRSSYRIFQAFLLKLREGERERETEKEEEEKRKNFQNLQEYMAPWETLI